MTTTEICSILPRVADPLCRIMSDPAAAYVLASLHPSKLAIFSLFLTKHKEDMYSIIDALSADLADRPFLDGFAKIPAEAIHELACLVLEIYMGVTRR